MTEPRARFLSWRCRDAVVFVPSLGAVVGFDLLSGTAEAVLSCDVIAALGLGAMAGAVIVATVAAFISLLVADLKGEAQGP